LRQWWWGCGGSGNSNSDSGGGDGHSDGGSDGIGSKGNSVDTCHTNAAMRSKHNNQPKEGCAAKMPEKNARNRQQPAGAMK
jgi:hypothetical protein